MSIAKYIKEIGRGKEGARSLTREQAHDLMSQVLEGKVTDLELGAFAIAMRIKGESPDELAGFLDAAHAHCLAITAPRPVVVLPSYNGARKLPVLTPLLALLLAHEGVPVLVHGPLRDPGRVTSAEVVRRSRAADCTFGRRHPGRLATAASRRSSPPKRCALRWRSCSTCAGSSGCATPAIPWPSCLRRSRAACAS